MSTLDLRCLMAQPNSGIGNVTANTGLVEMAMAYSRSRVLCAAARLGVADALGDEVRSVGFLAEECQADATALHRLPERQFVDRRIHPSSARLACRSTTGRPPEERPQHA